jgi:hypothetical protein
MRDALKPTRHGEGDAVTVPLALRKAALPAPEPVAFEEAVYEAEWLASAAYVLASYLAEPEETDAKRTAQLLADALERQAALLRAFMDSPDDPAEGRADG